MNTENTTKLFTDFPQLYAGKDMSIQANLMPFGFECGDGWFQLIYDLSKKLSEVAPECLALQVKEKFGGLRFYVGGCNEDGHKLIDMAEEQSYHTCEACGDTSTAKERDGSWISTLCDVCNDKRKEN